MKSSSLFKMLVVAITLQSAALQSSQASDVFTLTEQEGSKYNWKALVRAYQDNPKDAKVRALIARYYDEDLANGNEATKTFLKDVVVIFGGKENIEKMKLDSLSARLKAKAGAGLASVKNNPVKALALATAVSGFVAAYKQGRISKPDLDKVLYYAQVALGNGIEYAQVAGSAVQAVGSAIVNNPVKASIATAAATAITAGVVKLKSMKSTVQDRIGATGSPFTSSPSESTASKIAQVVMEAVVLT